MKDNPSKVKSQQPSAQYDLAVALEYRSSNGGATVSSHGKNGAQRATSLHSLNSRSGKIAAEEQQDAPKVTVKGNAEDADWLVKTARAMGIPVVEDGRTAKLLSEVPLDAEIPPQFYRAVALILTNIERAKNRSNGM